MNHLREHKCKHNFEDCLNPICSCGLDIEPTSHFLLHCPTFNDERYTLLSTLNNIDCKLLELTKPSLLPTFYMATHYLIKKKTHASSTQQLNIFYLLKDFRSLLFSQFPSESLNPSSRFLKYFYYIYFLSLLSFIFFFYYFYLFPGILEFWCLVTAFFKFTVLNNSIYRKKSFDVMKTFTWNAF